MGAINRLYAVTLDAAAVTTSPQDLFLLGAPSGENIVLHGFELTSQRTTEEGTDTRARIRLLRRSTAGSGGSSATPLALDGNNAVASGVTAATLRTTQGTAGNVLAVWYWSQQNSLLYLPPPEMRIVVPASGFLALEIVGGLAATRNMAGWLKFEEG